MAEAIVIFGYLATFRLVAHHLGTVGFGEYALSRRALALLAPIGMMGVDMAIARYLAYGDYERDGPGYRVAALASMVTSVGCLSIVLVVLQNPIAHLFYGSGRYSELVVALPPLLLGGGLHGIAYGDLRGRMRIQQANLLMTVNQGLVPLAAAFVAPTATALLLWMGLAWSVVSGLTIAVTKVSIQGFAIRVKDLVGYGLRRIPGDLIQLSLFAAPSILVAQRSDITEAGITAFGLAALGMVGSALTPIQFVLLPVAARYLSGGSVHALRAHLHHFLPWVVALLVSGTLATEVAANELVRLYLGPNFERGADVLRLVMLSALPWGLVVTLRSVIDARHYRAINARNMAVGFIAFALATAFCLAVGAPLWAPVVSFDVGIYVVAVLTVIEVIRITTGTDASMVPGERATLGDGVTPAVLVNVELRTSETQGD